MTAFEHGFGAGMILLSVVVLASLLTVGKSFQVHELVDDSVIAVIDEVQKTMVPVHNFLLAKSEVSMVL